MVQEGDRVEAAAGFQHHDLPVGRIDEADAEPIGLGQPLRGGPPSVSTRTKSRSASNPNQTRLKQAPRDQRHGPAVVAADIARRVDPLEIGGAAVDLDVGETDRLVVDRPLAAACEIGVNSEPGGSQPSSV